MNDTNGTEIILNVYLLGDDVNMKKMHWLSSVGFGLCHSEIEINGLAFCYGGDPNNSGSGVMQMSPLSAPGAVYKESFLMGVVHDQKFLYATLDELKRNFVAKEYSLVSQNCNHFADALCWRLLGKRIPSYINRLARVGSWVKFILPQSLKSLNPIPADPSAAAMTEGHAHQRTTSSGYNSTRPSS